MYDVHGRQAGSPPNNVKEITAGGNGRNGDNSFEANNGTPLGNGCFTTTIARPAPAAPAAGGAAAAADSPRRRRAAAHGRLCGRAGPGSLPPAADATSPAREEDVARA